MRLPLRGDGDIVGDLPGALFLDGQPRAPMAVYEVVRDGRAVWVVDVDASTADTWAQDLTQVVRTEYAEASDARRFVLADFRLESEAHALEVAPPMPHAVDWRARDRQDVVLWFAAHKGFAVEVPDAEPVPEPVAAPDTFAEWLQDTTPGGGVTAQLLIVLVVYVMFLYAAAATPWGVMLAAAVLILTPWLPYVLGLGGDPILASILFVNIGLGAFGYKALFQRTE